MTSSPLERFGRFLLLRPLAEGGMGLVLLAYDPLAARIVALKRLGKRASLELRERFADEALATRHLRHRHLVEFLDSGEVDGEPYLALGFVPGHDLHALCARLWAQERRVPIDVALELAFQLADGLAHAHASGDGSYVHRDVTPMNVLVGFDGSVRLADHGLAKMSGKGFHTIPGVATGTVGFVSPEQLAAGPVDRRSDVYGVGGVLWFMLTGRPPCDPMDPTKSLVEARRLAHFAPGLPEAVEAVIYRALASRAADRYASAAALRDALLALLRSSREAKELPALMEVAFPGEAAALAAELAELTARARALGPVRPKTRANGLGLGLGFVVLTVGWRLGLGTMLEGGHGGTSRSAGWPSSPPRTTAMADSPAVEPSPRPPEPPEPPELAPRQEALAPRGPAPKGEAAIAPSAGPLPSADVAAQSPPPSSNTLATMRLRLLEARGLGRRGMFARASALYDELERDGASVSAVLTGRAELALLRGSLDEAIERAGQAIRFGGGSPALLVRARALSSRGRREESEADYHAVLRDDPSNTDAKRALEDGSPSP